MGRASRTNRRFGNTELTFATPRGISQGHWCVTFPQFIGFPKKSISIHSNFEFQVAYEKVLELCEKSKAASVRRDVSEGAARCCLRMGQGEKAEEWARRLHATSHANNPDHQVRII